MKLYIVSCICGISSYVYATVGEDYDSVFSHEICSLREKYGCAIDSITVKEITQCQGYKVVLEKIDVDLTEIPIVFGRKGK